MTDTTHEAPERIWLQLGAGDEGTHTWADHQVGWDDEGEYEPEYVRADLVQAVVAVERWHCARVVERMAPYTPKQIAQMSGIDRFAKQRKITLSRMYHAAAAAIRKGGE